MLFLMQVGIFHLFSLVEIGNLLSNYILINSSIPGDTRESAAIYIGRHLLDEGAYLSIYDPKVS